MPKNSKFAHHSFICFFKVQFVSEFLFNGLLVRLTGQINARTLAGNAHVELLQQQQPQIDGGGGTATASGSELLQQQQRDRRERVERRLAQLRDAALRL